MTSNLRQEIYQELMWDSTEYCCYCGQERFRLGCCGEVHYEVFADMDKENQDAILDVMVDERLAKEKK